jgi:hypothetical protein
MVASPLDPFALAIGRLCHAWAELELQVTEHFICAAGMDRNVSGALSMVDCLDFRDKIASVKIGVVARAKGQSTREWAEEVIDTLDYIDNTLRNRRNRLIHDKWDPHPKGATRIVFAPRIYRPQARKPLTLMAAQSYFETVEDVELVAKDIANHDEWLGRLRLWRYGGRRSPIATLLAERPLRLVLPLQP